MNCSVARCSDGGYQVSLPRITPLYFATLWEAMDAAYSLVKNGQTVDAGISPAGSAVSNYG